MYFPYVRPLVNYGRFLLEEERKRKIIEAQLPKIAAPTLFNQRNNISFIPKGMLEQGHSSPRLGTLPFFMVSTLTAFQKPTTLQQQDAAQQPKQISSVGISDPNEFILKSIFSKQYAANIELEDQISIGNLKSLKNSFVMSVFDGHGGKTLAEYCSSNIVEMLDQIIDKNLKGRVDTETIDELIVKSLKLVYEKIENTFYDDIYSEHININPNKNNKMRNVGTCGITILVYKKKMYVANCGDSQAIVISSANSQNYEYKKLNERLSVNNPHERKRIYNQYPDEQDIIIQQSKGVYYLKGRLQPTRTIGDYYLKKQKQWKGKKPFNGPYLSCVPEVSIFDIEENNKQIIIGSDGIWDFIDKWALTRICGSHDDSSPQNLCEEIVKNTLQKIGKIHGKSMKEISEISKQLRRNYFDDISVITFNIQEYMTQYYPPPINKVDSQMLLKQQIDQPTKSNTQQKQLVFDDFNQPEQQTWELIFEQEDRKSQ